MKSKLLESLVTHRVRTKLTPVMSILFAVGSGSKRFGGCGLKGVLSGIVFAALRPHAVL